MLVVQSQDGPDVGTPLLPLHLVAKLATGTMEGGGKSDRLESGQMQICANHLAVLRGRVWPSGDGLPGGY
jgi:hypothetical protein